MRICNTFLIFAALCLAIAGCEKQSAAPVAAEKAETFPEPKQSTERTAFEKLASKKKEYLTKQLDMANANRNELGAIEQENPGLEPGAGLPTEGGPPPTPPTDEVKAARKELGKLRREQSKKMDDLTKEYVKFLDNEYTPGMLNYAEFCHKTFVAEPNKANGGELIKLAQLSYDNGNVDQVYQYCKDLLKNEFDSVILHDLAAAAAFCTDRFDEGEEYFGKAIQRGSTINVMLVAVKSDFSDAKKAWEKEQASRTKEAAADDLPRVKLETEVGDIVVELYENEAPETVANYISLVESGYFDNTTFYSVIQKASIAHGSKTGSDHDSPGYRIYSEADKADRRFPFRGTLTMFEPNKNNQGGSVYTIALKTLPNFDGHYTTFGRIIEGFDTLPKITKYNARASGDFPYSGMAPTKVIKATVLRKRNHEYKPHKVETTATGS